MAFHSNEFETGLLAMTAHEPQVCRLGHSLLPSCIWWESWHWNSNHLGGYILDHLDLGLHSSLTIMQAWYICKCVNNFHMRLYEPARFTAALLRAGVYASWSNDLARAPQISMVLEDLFDARTDTNIVIALFSTYCPHPPGGRLVALSVLHSKSSSYQCFSATSSETTSGVSVKNIIGWRTLMEHQRNQIRTPREIL
jgi:hypothetical protein